MSGEPTILKAKRRTRAEVKKLVEEFRRSGMRRIDFCRDRHLSLSTLTRHLRRSKRQERTSKSRTTAKNRMLPVEIAAANHPAHACSSGSDIEIPHQWSIPRKESRVAGDEQVSSKTFQWEWSGFAAKTPRPRACSVDDDRSLDFTVFCVHRSHRRSLDDQGFTSAVGDDLKAGVPGLGQQIAQQGVDVNDSIGGTEDRGIKFKPAQKRESLPGFVSGQQFGGHALFL